MSFPKAWLWSTLPGSESWAKQKNQSWMNDLDTLTSLIRIKIQSKLKKKYIQIALLFLYYSCFTQHTFADAHPIPEDLCCVLGKPKLLNWDGTQLSLNQAKDKDNKHIICTVEGPLKIHNTNCAIKKRKETVFLFFFFKESPDWINLPVHFHLTGFDLSFNGKPGKIRNHLIYNTLCLRLPLCISNRKS